MDEMRQNIQSVPSKPGGIPIEDSAQPVVNMFWEGPLSSLEIACINTFLSRGIHVNVFSYERLNLPLGASLEDASEILPKAQLFFFDGSPSAFSNIFRYKLLFERGGWWVDADVVLIEEQLPDSEYYWAWEDPEKINGAILKFPSQDPLCEELLSLSIEGAKGLSKWGALGPDLLTLVLAQHQGQNAGSTVKTYPIHWLETHYLWFPEFTEVVKERLKKASFLHLWHSIFARMGIDLATLPPEGSYLHHLLGAPMNKSRDVGDVRNKVRDYLLHDSALRKANILNRSINPPNCELSSRNHLKETNS